MEKSFIGSCPFCKSNEKYFSISPAKGIYHCFSCGEGGNVTELKKITLSAATNKVINGSSKNDK